MATRALLNLPKTARRGDVIEVRATVAHPMETGYRADADGRVLPRDLVRRVGDPGAHLEELLGIYGEAVDEARSGAPAKWR